MQARTVDPETRAEFRDSVTNAGAGGRAMGSVGGVAGDGDSSRGGASAGSGWAGGGVTSKRRLALGKSPDDISMSSVFTSGIVFLATLLDPFLAMAR